MNTRLRSASRACIPVNHNYIAATGISLFLAYSSAQADGSWAPTDGNSVTGLNSIAGGINNTVNGDAAVALGVNNIIGNNNVIAIGTGNRPTASGVATIGLSNYGSNNDAIAIGRMNNASGATSNAVGNANRSQGQYSTAMGFGNLATGDQSTALGFLNTAGGLKSVALGRASRAYGDTSMALGIDAVSNFDNAIAIGIGASTTQQNQIVIGTSTDTITMAGALAQGDASTDRIVTVDASGNIQSVTTTELFSTLGAASVGPNSIDTSHIADGSITNAKLTPEVQNRFANLESATEKLQSGMAMSYAMSNIPHYIDPLKNHSFGVGLGAYDGKAAFAVALNSRLDENVRGRISLARGTQDKTIGFGAGLLWQW